jgi:asparagine synthetase B (glutamine-hydrolysing)
VPVGVFLSGGLDYTAVLAQMCSFMNDKPQGFTIGFDDRKNDKSGIAEQACKRLPLVEPVYPLLASSGGGQDQSSSSSKCH